MRGRRLRRSSLAVLAASLALGAAPASGDGEALPNLVPSLHDIAVGRADEGGGRRAIRFDLRSENRGAHALDVAGVPTGPDGYAALQCVAWAARGACTERRPVGTFSWHPQHAHWHFDDFATYELRLLTADGQPDPTPGGLVASNGKVSFCLMDSQRASSQGGAAFYSFCTGVLQGISAGWADIYGSGLYGQQVPLTGVADGVYALVATINPAARLLESSYDDNVAWVTVRISGGGSAVEVVETP